MPDACWHVVGKSVTGTSHLRAGRECDDAHTYRVYGQELLLIAVADGAGSASQSAIGAATSVEVAITTAERILYRQIEPYEHVQWISVLNQILTTAHDALIRLAEDGMSTILGLPEPIQSIAISKPSLREFATTLLIAIVTRNWIAVAQIGDGAVVIQRTNGSIVSLTPRQRGVYINETDFLTDTEYLTLTDYTVAPRADTCGIALLTDGLQLLAMTYPENSPHQPFFEPLFKYAGNIEANTEGLEHFLTSDRVCEQTDDDKTLVLAVYQ